MDKVLLLMATYLLIKVKESNIKTIRAISFDHNQSQVFIETPYSNNKMLEDICNILQPNTEYVLLVILHYQQNILKQDSKRMETYKGRFTQTTSYLYYS